jgi:peptide/nickel transport system ATP-binding protein
MSVLDVRGLSVEFRTPAGAVRVIDDVSLSLAAGEVLGVVGESGAGKSVAGLAITGLLPSNARVVAGEVTVEGRTFAHPDRESLRPLRGPVIGMVFQNPMTSLDPLFTIGSQLAETLEVHGIRRGAAARQRAAELLDEVGLKPAVLDLYPHQLSGGMRQRAVLALAMAPEPRILIADEPTTALDSTTQAQVLRTLLNLCRQHGVAMILVTHDIALLSGAADRTMVMYAGRVAEVAPTDRLIGAPVHPYTQGLIASIPPLGRRMERLVQLEGSMPRPDMAPPGCRFAPRCPVAINRCSSAVPPLVADGPRAAACWLHPSLVAHG